jgi:hypothetical protein
MRVLRDPLALVELVEHGCEPSLPRAAAVGLGVGDVLTTYDEEQRERVLAAVADRAAAAAVDPHAALGLAHRDVALVGHARRPGHPAADVEVALAVDLVADLEHEAAVDVVEGPVERDRPEASGEVGLVERHGQVHHVPTLRPAADTTADPHPISVVRT